MLDHALTVFERLNTARIVECFVLYLEKSEVTISGAEARQRRFQKLVNPTFFTELRPLLTCGRCFRQIAPGHWATSRSGPASSG